VREGWVARVSLEGARVRLERKLGLGERVKREGEMR
jgi:hypothetical protein